MSDFAPNNGLYTVNDLGRDGILRLLDRAETLRTEGALPQTLAGKIVCLLFFQPSTRTRIGFHTAALRLGGQAVQADEAKFQPDMDAPESPEDTVRVLSAYSDLLVIRHGDADVVRGAFAHSSVPAVNAGAGADAHPTQALIDLYAVRRRLGRLEGLRVGLAGDLAGSRAAKSLVRALAYFPPETLRIMAPHGRRLPEELLAPLSGTRLETFDRLVLVGLEILYMAGCPGLGPTGIPVAARRSLCLTVDAVATNRHNTLFLCPLPRVDEIEREVDNHPSAGYFDQSAQGAYVRMAVLEKMLLGETSGAI